MGDIQLDRRRFLQCLPGSSPRLEVDRLDPQSRAVLADGGLTEPLLLAIAGKDHVVDGSKEWSALFDALASEGRLSLAERSGSGPSMTKAGLAFEAVVAAVPTKHPHSLGSIRVSARVTGTSSADRVQAFEAAEKKWGTRALQWLHHLGGAQGTSLVEAISTAAKPELGIRPAFLCAIALGEGLNLYLDANGGRTDEWIDGYQYLGTDTFGSRVSALQARGLVSSDLQKGTDFRLRAERNERGQAVLSAEFKNVSVGLAALAGLLADERQNVLQDVGALFGKEAAESMSQDQAEYWTYVYFNGGAKVGRALLERDGVEGARAWRGTAPRENTSSCAFNAAQRMAFVALLDELQVFAD